MSSTKFRVLSLNIEGMSTTKVEILASLDIDVICLQETHKDWTEGPHCSDQDLKEATETALHWIRFYRDKI